MFARRFLPKLGGPLRGPPPFAGNGAVFSMRVRQSLNRPSKPLAVARAFHKALSRLARPADVGSIRLLANLVSQPEQGPV